MIIRKSTLFCAVAVSAALIFGCSTKQVVKGDETTGEPQSRISTIAGDTVSYTINFKDNEERERFLAQFKLFLEDYPFAKVLSGSTAAVVVKVLPVSSVLPGDEKARELSSQRTEYVGSAIQKAVDESLLKDTIYTTTAPDTLTPATGGTVKIYIQRSNLEEPMLSLVSAYPFQNGQGNGFLTVGEQSARKITLRLNGRFTNGKGKILSALDIIDCWTQYVKKNPAEGFALFRQVEGMREYIDGREAVIRGFLASDQNTIQMRLVQPDSNVVDRISTSRLLGVAVKCGLYYEESSTQDEFVLLSNKASGRKTGYLDKIVVKLGGDPNPVLSFSLKKYDGIALVTKSDIEYARTSLAKNGKLDVLAKERYFISITNKEPAARKYLCSLVKAQDILDNFVKAEGECIGALEQNVAVSTQSAVAAKHPGMIQPVKVLFRKDDPASKIIAEKLIAEFTKGNVPCLLAGASVQEYEKLLVSRNYGCVIGWVTDAVINDKCEKLRLATMWFADNTDENLRIENNYEIPLFSINKYLLYRNTICIPQNNIQNIFLQQGSNGK